MKRNKKKLKKQKTSKQLIKDLLKNGSTLESVLVQENQPVVAILKK